MEKGKDGFCRRRLSDEGGETHSVDGRLSDEGGETDPVDGSLSD